MTAAAPELLFPGSPDEAASFFGDGAGVTVFAGGTILMPEIAAGRVRPGRTLMLGSSGLDAVTIDGGVVRIGATVPLAVVVRAPERVLTEAAAHVADPEVRAQGTVGGNLCATPGREAPRGDLQAPLIALGAEVRSVGKGGERVEPVEDFLAGDRGSRLVLEVSFSLTPRRQGYAHLRRPHAHSYTALSVAACAAPDRSGLRVAVGGAGPTAVRCPSVEASGNPDDVLEDVTPQDDALASAWYRSRMLPVLVRRALDELDQEPA